MAAFLKPDHNVDSGFDVNCCVYDVVDSSLSGPVSTKYKLVAIVTHLGRNSNSGHYVCHLRSEVRGLMFQRDPLTQVSNLTTLIGNRRKVVAFQRCEGF